MFDRRQFLLSSGAAVGALAMAPGPARATSPQPPRPLLRLNFNENALGMSPRAAQAIHDHMDVANRYPGEFHDRLRALIARLNDFHEEQVVLGNGSTDLIRMVVMAHGRGGAALVTAEPTFAIAELYARPLGTRILRLPLTPRFQLDLAAMRGAAESHDGPVLVYICNPNNPTATVVPARAIREWVEGAGDNLFFVVDEAYHDYAQNPDYGSALELVREGHDNLFVTRTFSKVYGMAGLRVGYGFGTAEVAARIGAFAGADNINMAGAVAAAASLEDKDWLPFSIDANRRARETLYGVLDQLGIEYVSSETNFAIHRIAGPLADYQARMRATNVLVGRAFPRLQGWNRLSMGTPDEMEIFAAVLRDFRDKGWV